MDVFDEIRQLVRQANELRDGPVRVALLRQAVDLAETTNVFEWQFETRLRFVEGLFHAGEADELLVHVAWCLAAIDRENDYDFECLVIPMFSVLVYVAGFHSITRGQIDQLLDDFEDRCQRHGVGKKIVHRVRCYNEIWMGDHKQAVDSYRLMINAKSDQYHSEASPYAALFRADYHIHLSDYAGAWRESSELLQGNCQSGVDYEWFAWLGSFMLLPLVRLGHFDEAVRVQPIAYDFLKDNAKHVDTVSHHISYFSVIGKLDKASRLVERHSNWAVECCVDRQRFEFWLAALMLMKRFRQSGTKVLPFRLPEGIPLVPSSVGYEVEQVERWLSEEVRKLKELFDARNGNDYFTRIVNDRLGYCED